MRQVNVWALTAAGVLSLASVAGAQFGNQPAAGIMTEEGIRVQAYGRVQSVVDQNSFVLIANGVRLTVNARQREVVANQTIRTGQEVRVFGELVGENRVNATQVQVLGGRGGREDRETRRASRTLTGTIREIDRRNNRMSVAVPAGNVRVEWDANTEFLRSNTRGTVASFREGESVRIIGRRDGLNAIQARRIIFGGQPGWTNGAVGEIVGLDSRTREIDVDFAGEVWVVRVGTASVRRGNQRLQFDELRLDQDIRVTGTARGTRSVDATAVDVLR